MGLIFHLNVTDVCALPDSFNAIQVFTNAFCEPVAYRTIKSEQQQALFLQYYSNRVLFLSYINLYTGLLFYLTQYRIFNTKFVFDVLMCGV